MLQFLVNSAYLTFYFILFVQPMKKFHNSKCLQDNAEVRI